MRAKVDNKGRITIPAEFREKLGIREGMEIDVRLENGVIILSPIKNVAEKYAGIFKGPKIEEDVDKVFYEEVEKMVKKHYLR
ncbi:MAG: AbrB/MazE/SpoVT family DNA-binding domain-containing protein [Sulfolobaceae archaeon]|nr:AbrB/MazE/SpoVT family DNA-binding domain-containing protein [Sulfolobaceae archaeon]